MQQHFNSIDTTRQQEVSHVKPYNDVFAKEILEGLTAQTKSIPSKYFYDDHGSVLFQKIMQLPEYYLTNSETEIFSNFKSDIYKIFSHGEPFQLVELGAGDGTKTKILIDYFLKQKASFDYLPVDISLDILIHLRNSLKIDFPDLSVHPLAKEYIAALEDINKNTIRKVLLFIGSSIGNFKDAEAIDFLKTVSYQLTDKDYMIIGFDLKKNPEVMIKAYNDKEGITADFNFNLLKRINKALDGDFNIKNFMHQPVYDPVEGEMRSYLVSNKKQEVRLRKYNAVLKFEEWEPIFTEVSKKYTIGGIEKIAQEAGFAIEKIFMDAHKYFAVGVFKLA
jgi:L-histidine N-alpha-methyltransferase